MRFGLKCLASVAVTMSLAVALRADWEPPKDNVFTEKQLVTYIESMKDVLDQWKAMGKKLEGAGNGVAAAAVVGQLDEKFDALLARHGTQRKEFEWMSNQAAAAYGNTLVADAMGKMKAEYDAQGKKAQQDLADAQKKAADYAAADKAGKRMLTKEDREIAIKEAKDQQQAAIDEMKQHSDEVKVIGEEIAKDEADIKAAETQAKNVPAGVADTDREDFVKQKQADAAAARDAAKEAREREAEAKKAVAESKTKVDFFAKKIANPEVPLTDDEKAQAKQENQEGIKACKEEIEKVTNGIEMLKNADIQLAKMVADQNKDVPAANVELMKKHVKEYLAALGAEEKK